MQPVIGDHQLSRYDPGMPSPARVQRFLLLAFKICVLAVVAWGIARTASIGWSDLKEQDIRLDLRWLIVSAGLYVLGLLPPAWYWWRLLWALGGQPTWHEALVAHMYGHLGKYVPGKGLVVVLRTATLSRERVPLLEAVVAVFLETLTLMAIGALLAALLTAWLIGWDARTVGGALLVLLLVGVPTLPPVTRRLVEWLRIGQRSNAAAQESASIREKLGRFRFPLAVRGWYSAAASWLLLGMSLAAVVRALPEGNVVAPPSLASLVAAVSLSTVLGFLSLIPAGLGVRDGLLVMLLSPDLGEANAILVSALLRMVWITTELGVCGILHIVRRWLVRSVRSSPTGQGANSDSEASEG